MRDRENIYQEIQAERPRVLRPELTPRIWAVMDGLLDELVALQHLETIQSLEDEANL